MTSHITTATLRDWPVSSFFMAAPLGPENQRSKQTEQCLIWLSQHLAMQQKARAAPRHQKGAAAGRRRGTVRWVGGHSLRQQLGAAIAIESRSRPFWEPRRLSTVQARWEDASGRRGPPQAGPSALGASAIWRRRPWCAYRRRAAVSSCLSRPRASPTSAAASFSAALSSSTCCTAAWKAAAAWSIRLRAWPACCSSEEAAFSASLRGRGAGEAVEQKLSAGRESHPAVLRRAFSETMHTPHCPTPAGHLHRKANAPPSAAQRRSLGGGRRLLGLVHCLSCLSGQRRQLLLGLLAQLGLARALRLPAIKAGMGGCRQMDG